MAAALWPFIRRLSMGLALCSLTTSVSVEAIDLASAEAGLALLHAADLRVATVTFRLAAANKELCKDHAPLSGLSLHDASQYSADYRPAAIRLFDLGDEPGVMAVVAGSPADRAGLQTGDAIVAINNVSTSEDFPAWDDKSAPPSYERMSQLLERLDAALKRGPITIDVRRGGEKLSLLLTPVIGCASQSQLLPDDHKDAGADGRMISITTALVDYTLNDDELAAVIGHEMAHNALRHRLRLEKAGVARGLLSHFGRNATAIRATEKEADRVGLYMMARAGFELSAAPTFWRRFGRATDLGIFSDPTHPRWRERERDLISSIDEIRTMQASGRRLIPSQSPAS
jgi:Zn-dependent protease with chaperone function